MYGKTAFYGVGKNLLKENLIEAHMIFATFVL